MERKPPRRSAGMLGSPLSRGRDAAPAPPVQPRRPAPEPAPPQAQPRASRLPKPKVLIGEMAAPRGTEVGEFRDAFRAFMTAHSLRPTEWAKKAGVPVGEILAYLTGRQRFFAQGVAEKLAAAAGVSTEAMFAKK
ncbi:MAG: hypothetical protein H6924_03690 [Alphaproteobacteria bacterium]|nr:hypothetical protein [Alphaproteobacteria bacterium]